MVIRNGIRELILFVLILLISVSCNDNTEIDNMLGCATSNKITLKETYCESDFFHSEYIRIYIIKDTTLYGKIGNDFCRYDKSFKSNYCSQDYKIYKYIKQGAGFYRINEVSSCRFVVLYIDTMNQKLFYHDVSYTID
ncbi:hypothetical protein II906_05320 [bacterium]|nr:hypothetical protein [bacterium]